MYRLLKCLKKILVNKTWKDDHRDNKKINDKENAGFDCRYKQLHEIIRISTT